MRDDARSRVLAWCSGFGVPTGSLPQRMRRDRPDLCRQCGVTVADWPTHDAWHDALTALLGEVAADA